MARVPGDGRALPARRAAAAVRHRATAADATRRAVAEARAARERLLFCWRRDDTGRLAEQIAPHRAGTRSTTAPRPRRAARAAAPRRRAAPAAARARTATRSSSAALAPEERAAVEAAAAGGARVVCCTQTLAAGVNLPAAKVVVLCGADKFPTDAVQLAQMLGRAGSGGARARGEARPSSWRRGGARRGRAGCWRRRRRGRRCRPSGPACARRRRRRGAARLLLEAVCATEADGAAFDAAEGPAPSRARRCFGRSPTTARRRRGVRSAPLRWKRRAASTSTRPGPRARRRWAARCSPPET